MLLLTDKKTFNLELVDGHLLIVAGGKRVLIDTGSPVSLGLEAEFEFLGKSWPLRSSLLGADFENIRELLGFHIDVLVGMDILANYHVLIDVREGEIAFHHARPAFEGEEIPLELAMSVPVISVRIDGRAFSACFDTGAKLCYFWQDAVAGYAIDRTVPDFYPARDTFETGVRTVPVSIGRGAIRLETGVLPKSLHDELMSTGMEGIVGTPLLEHCAVCLAFPDGVMVLQIYDA